jgi:hypothetical protein
LEEGSSSSDEGDAGGRGTLTRGLLGGEEPGSPGVVAVHGNRVWRVEEMPPPLAVTVSGKARQVRFQWRPRRTPPSLRSARSGSPLGTN